MIFHPECIVANMRSIKNYIFFILQYLKMIFKASRAWRLHTPRCSSKLERTQRRAREQPRAWSRWGGCAAARWG
jgi:hypothetical protein